MSKNNRILRIISSINIEGLNEFSQELDELLAKSNDSILIELCSDGGDAYAGIGYHSKIIQAPCTIRVDAFGHVMSAATVILAAADWRVMHKDTWFMVHADSQKVRAETGAIAISEARHNIQLENHWAHILARHSNKSAKWWRMVSDRTTYMTAKDCLKIGIIDEIY